MSITERKAYHVTYTRKHHGADDSYRANRMSLRGAASKLAWWMVFDKHGDTVEEVPPQEQDRSSFLFAPSDYRTVRHEKPGIPCLCGEQEPSFNYADGGYDAPFEWAGCPLHDRKTGYYRRLHDRLTSFIVSTIKAEGVTR